MMGSKVGAGLKPAPTWSAPSPLLGRAVVYALSGAASSAIPPLERGRYKVTGCGAAEPGCDERAYARKSLRAGRPGVRRHLPRDQGRKFRPGRDDDARRHSRALFLQRSQPAVLAGVRYGRGAVRVVRGGA